MTPTEEFWITHYWVGFAGFAGGGLLSLAVIIGAYLWFAMRGWAEIGGGRLHKNHLHYRKRQEAPTTPPEGGQKGEVWHNQQ